MKQYSDLYIEFDEENLPNHAPSQESAMLSGIDVVSGSYTRGGLIKHKESYTSLEFKGKDIIATHSEEAVELISNSIGSLVGRGDKLLMVGLGNYHYKADALGQSVLDSIEKSEGVYKLYPQCRSVTGIESYSMLRAAIRITRPDIVIVIDSLATSKLDRLGRVVQLTDGGITPGGGLTRGARRLTRQLLGVPILAIGAPLIIKAAAIDDSITADDIMTSANIDSMVSDLSSLIARGINSYLYINKHN